MKKITIKNLLLICIVANLLGSLAHAAVGDWFSRTKERSKEYVLRKVGETEQKVKKFLASLRANTNCLVRGDCPPERMRTLRAIAGAIATAAVILTAAAIASKYAKGDGRVVLVSRGGIPNIQTVIAPFGVQYAVNDQEQNMFLTATYNGLREAQRYADLVKRNVLKAGIALAGKLYEHFAGIGDARKADPYKTLKESLTDVEKDFNDTAQQANESLLGAVRQESQELVTQAYCGLTIPSQNAVTVGIEILKDRERKYGKEDIKIRPIIEFLTSPRCPASAAGG